MPSPDVLFRRLCGWAEPVSEAAAEVRLRLGSLGIPSRLISGVPEPAVVVSACLLGVACRYDGRSNWQPRLWERLARLGVGVLALCPECLAGFGVPRARIHFQGGDGARFLEGRARLVDEFGADRSASFLLGVRRALELARRGSLALLKESSPSCGLGRVHVDEGFVSGQGAWAAGLAGQMPCFSERHLGRFLAAVARLVRGRPPRAGSG